MTEWQPIETAPKDGTEILAVSANAAIPIVGATRFHWDNWATYDWDERSYIDAIWFPTHWMPLPTPPKDTAS